MTRHPESQASDTDRRDLASLPAELRPWLLETGDAKELDLDAMRSELDAQIASERGVVTWLRSRSTWTRMGALALAGMLLTSGTLLGAPRVDLAHYPPTRMLVAVALLGALYLANAALALWPLHWPLPPRWLRLGCAAAVPLTLLGLYLLPPALAPDPAWTLDRGASALLTRAAPCLLIGLAVVAAVAAVLRAFDRQREPVFLWAAGAGGIAANLVLQLHCPITARDHLLVGHFGVALLALLAALVLRAERPKR